MATVKAPARARVVKLPDRPAQPRRRGRPPRCPAPVIIPIAPPLPVSSLAPFEITCRVPPRAFEVIIRLGDAGQIPDDVHVRNLVGGWRASFGFMRIVRPDGLPDVEGPTLAR